VAMDILIFGCSIPMTLMHIFLRGSRILTANAQVKKMRNWLSVWGWLWQVRPDPTCALMRAGASNVSSLAFVNYMRAKGHSLKDWGSVGHSLCFPPTP